MGFRQAFLVGAAQALALIPGFSRSGATMGGGLVIGLSHRDAARFAFLLATPIIGAAAISSSPSCSAPKARACAAKPRRLALLAATAYLAVRFLLRYFETRTLIPFAIWCLGFGAAFSLYFLAA